MSAIHGADPVIARWLTERAPDMPPPGLADATRTAIEATPQRSGRWPARPSSRRLTWVLVAALAVVVAGLFIVGPGAPRSVPVPSVPVVPAATSAPDVATPVPNGELPERWMPGTRGNGPAGQYAWRIGDWGWMHQVRDAGEYQIQFEFELLPGAGPIGSEDVTVAGYPGRFQEFPPAADGSRRLVWDIPMEEGLIRITSIASAAVPQAAMAEVFAIVDSIRREPTRGAYMLTFTLREGWDTG